MNIGAEPEFDDQLCCPHCGERDRRDMEDGARAVITCTACGKPFVAEFQLVPEYATVKLGSLYQSSEHGWHEIPFGYRVLQPKEIIQDCDLSYAGAQMSNSTPVDNGDIGMPAKGYWCIIRKEETADDTNKDK
jgi:sarcosine oxidase delta subunit